MRWFFLLFFGVVVTALIEPWLVNWFDSIGWYSAGGPIVNWIERLIGEAAFPWVAGFAFGLAAGAWSHFAATKFDMSKPSKEDRFYGLRAQIKYLNNEMHDVMRDTRGNYDFDKRSYKVDLKLVSLYSELNALGIKTPDYSACDNQTFNIGNTTFLQLMLTFSEQGQLKLGRKMAVKGIAEFKVIIEQLKSEQD